MATTRKPNEKDYITNKVLIVFSLCLLGVLVLMMINKMLFSANFQTGMTLCYGLTALAAVGFLAGGWKFSKEKKEGANTRYRLLTGANLLAVFGVMFLCMAVVSLMGVSVIKLFYVLLPALAVYCLIYYSYPREFFVVALDCGAAAALLALVRTAAGSSNYGFAAWVAVALAVLLTAGQILLMQQLKKKGCTGLVDGKRTQLFADAHAHLVMTITAVAMTAGVVVSAFLGAQAAYYLIFGAFGYLFVAAVYYTVKMM